jgi:hypothetical protein
MPKKSEFKHRTSKGERVRSKGEVIVADTLARLNIQYDYEKPLSNPRDKSEVLHPDFTIYHNGKVYYWEHLGMLSKAHYRKTWSKKRKWYERCGFSQSLIISKDSREGGTDSYEIEQTARKRILQGQTVGEKQYCEVCGEETPVDPSKPVCYSCWKAGNKPTQHCAGCGKVIDFNPKKPLCLSCWKQKKRPKQHCVECGKSIPVNPAKPYCYDCWTDIRDDSLTDKLIEGSMKALGAIGKGLKHVAKAGISKLADEVDRDAKKRKRKRRKRY